MKAVWTAIDLAVYAIIADSMLILNVVTRIISKKIKAILQYFVAYWEAMTTLTVTARGQVTFLKDLLHYRGIPPGDKI